jgi:uncharacterized coiled-coil protein SlyX
METREQIARLNERQVELQSIMAKSDKHLWGCLKKLLETFRENYPEDYAEYITSNDEYNDNEKLLKELEAKLAEEEQNGVVEHEEL